MRALITGASGFTGRYVRAELERHGWEVYGLSGHHPGDQRYQLQADLGDPAALSAALAKVRPQLVIHLAAIAFVGHGDPAEFYQVNTIGTRNLLAALAELPQRPDCVILASSANVYGQGEEDAVLTEASPPNPANDYAVSKLAMEYMAKTWLPRLPIVITRPFNYTGVGQAENFLLPKIVSHFQRRATRIELGNLDVWRDFSDVRAVATAYRRLAEVKPVGEIVNICSGRTHSLREVIAMAESLTGHSLEVTVNPAFVRANEVRSLRGDPSRLRSLIGEWSMPPLEETVAWMLAASNPAATDR
ncbi:MAG: GDP-mannose 4,6-dehydratase [Spongiibacteraceae bacterium]|jgi:nucleoside-diphosphate-sugar epimerase|nr:GDP-mannose 4,6-dehydratase [Spongiibacteraceae bacterium]